MKAPIGKLLGKLARWLGERAIEELQKELAKKG